MKYALICKNEPREQGYRVAEIVDAIPFEPSSEHFWQECDDTLKADDKWFDPSNNTYKNFPNQQSFKDQPTTTGTQTI